MEPKPKGNSILDRMPPEQRAEVDKWLFDENATYRSVVERCLKEFGVKVALPSVARYYQRGFRARSLDRFERTIHQKNEMLKIMTEKQHPNGNYELMIRMAENMAVEEALKPDEERDYRKVGYLARLIIAAKEESTSRVHADIAVCKMEMDIATECLIHKVKMDAILAEEGLDDGQRIEKIREELFGPDLPI
jgi:hypothetical protein